MFADDDDDPPIGTVIYDVRIGKRYYIGKGHWGWDPPGKEQSKKGEKFMSLKKNILWFGVIVAIVSVVIWLYKKLTAEVPAQGGTSL